MNHTPCMKRIWEDENKNIWRVCDDDTLLTLSYDNTIEEIVFPFTPKNILQKALCNHQQTLQLLQKNLDETVSTVFK